MSMFVVSPPRYIESHDCGYCHCKKYIDPIDDWPPQESNPPKVNTHITIGLFVHQMDTHQYAQLVNRGFRRLGRFLYTGDMLRGCCRMYTIRTNTHYYSLTKKHRKVINRFARAIGSGPRDPTESLGYDNLKSLVEIEVYSPKFRTRFEPAKFSQEKFALYKKYQVAVHNDDPDEVSQGQFKSFLCDTPFDAEVEGDDEQWEFLNNWKGLYGTRKCRRLGPTHECYYLDDKLIAISVLDFLPCGLSSVYFIWDPDYARLSLGTLLALREILMCKLLGLGDYYLGYYINDCPKMNYKGQFGGEILSVCNEAFIPFDMAKSLMPQDIFFVANGEFIKHGQEPDVELSKGRPVRWRYPLIRFSPGHYDKAVYDSSKDITVDIEDDYLPLDMVGPTYGDPEVYEAANRSKSLLENDYGLTFGQLPNVLPGAIPMLTLWGMFDSGIVTVDTTVLIYKTSSGRIVKPKIKDLDSTSQASYMDCLRLFGAEMLETMILVE